jgi:hypothetical protein
LAWHPGKRTRAAALAAIGSIEGGASGHPRSIGSVSSFAHSLIEAS